MMDGEYRWAANYEVKKKGAGKLIYSQIKTVTRGQWQEKAVKWTPIADNVSNLDTFAFSYLYFDWFLLLNIISNFSNNYVSAK